MKGHRTRKHRRISPVDLALAILGTRWTSPDAFQRAVRGYAWTHFHESLFVRSGHVPPFAARFEEQTYSAGCWTLDVRCWTFVLFTLSPDHRVTCHPLTLSPWHPRAVPARSAPRSAGAARFSLA